jgi:hypothetical protein
MHCLQNLVHRGETRLEVASLCTGFLTYPLPITYISASNPCWCICVCRRIYEFSTGTDAMKAFRGRRGMALIIHNLGARWSRSASRPGRFSFVKEIRHPLNMRGKWASEPFRTVWRGETVFYPTLFCSALPSHYIDYAATHTHTHTQGDDGIEKY